MSSKSPIKTRKRKNDEVYQVSKKTTSKKKIIDNSKSVNGIFNHFIPWSHQEKTRQQMLKREYAFVNSQYHKRNISLVCNDVGTGKTATVLYHILSNPTIGVNYKLDKFIHCFPSVLCNIIFHYLKIDLASFYENVAYFLRHDKSFFHFHEYPKEDKENLIDGGAPPPLAPPLAPVPFRKKKKNEIIFNGPDPDITLIDSNLIVCSHTLYKDTWKKDIQKFFPEASVYYICSSLNKIDKEEFKKHPVVLCNANKYAALVKYCNQYKIKWQRVFFDEVCAIHLPCCKSIDSLYYYGITTTYTDLPNIKNLGFIREKFASLGKTEVEEMMIICRDVDQQCRDFKPFIKRTVICKCDPDHQIINDCYPGTKLAQLMNEELFAEAKSHMVKLLLSNHHKQSYFSYTISDQKNFLAMLSNFSILELQLMNINNNRTLSDIIREQRTYHLLNCIYQAKICIRCSVDISDMKDTVCFKSPCCQLNYCFDCLPTVKECPICQKSITKEFVLNESKMDISGKDVLNKRIKYILQLRKVRNSKLKKSSKSHIDDEEDNVEDDDDDIEDSDEDDVDDKTLLKFQDDGGISNSMVLKKTAKQVKKEELQSIEIETNISKFTVEPCTFIEPDTLSKPVAALEIIKNHKGLRMLIFINNIKMTKILSKKFEESKITYEVLNGAPGHVTNVLKKLEDRSIDVVILNGNKAGSGVNIQMADVQIIYDVKNDQTLTQANGRSQRHGRSEEALIVYILTHDRSKVITDDIENITGDNTSDDNDFLMY